RLNLLVSGEVREQDWDQPGEWATLIRYARYRRPAASDEAQLAVAAGELSGVSLGFGALVDGYASGLDINHRHLGAHVRAYASRFGATAMIDDVVSPRLIAARAYHRPWRQLYLGAQVVTDLSAPTMEGNEATVGAAGDVAWAFRSRGKPWWVESYAQLATWVGRGSGTHLGARGQTRFGLWTLAAHVDGQLGSRSYLAGAVDALYERTRYLLGDGLSLVDRSDRGGLAGLGGVARASVARLGLGSIQLGGGHRSGLGARFDARVASAERARFQVAMTTAYQGVSGSDAAWMMASELRVRLPLRLYASAQAARLYRRTGDEIAPAWWLVATLGTVLGE
ncbi:MAG: hypothetical protein KJO07_18985, partial [Deltaproteobacteria bacterium]|nr:hypothetical protein [Deltaproteobacteria bacterium]